MCSSDLRKFVQVIEVEQSPEGQVFHGRKMMSVGLVVPYMELIVMQLTLTLSGAVTEELRQDGNESSFR